MREHIISAFASGAAKITVGLPFAILLIRTGVWWGTFEWAEMPNPTMRQTLVIAAVIVFVA